MNRTDVVQDAEYATNLGRRVRIVNVEPGWIVTKDGEHEQQQTYGQRKVKGQGFTQYKTNINVAAVEVDTGRNVVVEPRHLVSTWQDYVAEQQANVARLEASREQAQALAERAAQASLGPISTDPKRGTVTMTFEAFEHLLQAVPA